MLEDSLRKEPGGRESIRLILLPEMFATGYLPQKPSQYAEICDSSATAQNKQANPTVEFLQQLALEKNSTIVGALISKRQNSLKNSSAAFTPGVSEPISVYDKVHPFFPEIKRGFTAGNQVSLFKIGDWKIASVICYDLRFPELFRDAIKLGANLITVQAAWPLVRKEHWETLLRARAIENQVYVAAVNGVSPTEQDRTKKLAGTSMLIDPLGNVIARGSDSTEEVVRGSISLEPLLKYRKEFPVLEGIV